MWRSQRGMRNILLCDADEIIFIYQAACALSLSLPSPLDQRALMIRK